MQYLDESDKWSNPLNEDNLSEVTPTSDTKLITTDGGG